jgi:hypothetical protein
VLAGGGSTARLEALLLPNLPAGLLFSAANQGEGEGPAGFAHKPCVERGIAGDVGFAEVPFWDDTIAIVRRKRWTPS